MEILMSFMESPPRFWAVVRRLGPDFQASRDWLRRNGAALHVLDFGGRAA